MSKSRYYVEALSRGLQILEAFSEESPSLSLTEITASVGLERSTAFRFVHTLQKLGYLERDPETKLYRPGLRVLQLGFATLNSLEVAQIAQPYLKALFAECGETTNMTIRDGAEIVYVARHRTRQIVSANLHLGSRLPVHCTCMDKIQLIDLSRQELCEVLSEGPYRKMGPNTITTLDALVAELDKVRRLGYAINDEELAAGLRAVAAAVRDRSGDIVAAVNISIPTARASRQELEQVLAPMVIKTAREISLALGADVRKAPPGAGGAVGRVRVKSVALQMESTFAFALDQPLEVEGLGQITVDVSFAGGFFAMVSVDQIGLALTPENRPELARLGMAIIAAGNQQLTVQHPTRTYINTIDVAKFYNASGHAQGRGKNAVIYGEAHVDRSPCGTGTSAKMALMHRRGELAVGQPFLNEGILGTTFEGRVVAETTVGDLPAIVPEVRGSAHITAVNQFILDPRDPFPRGFLV